MKPIARKLLKLISKELELAGISYCYLDSSTAAKNRKEAVKCFQEDESIQVFLISLNAGGVGLNLTAADYVYLVDPWWNPAAEQQAIDRTHRIGQTRKIFAYKMICKGTVDKKILHLQQKKKSLAKDLVNEDSGFVKKEYCDFNELKPVVHGTGKSKTIALFHKYLNEGGYPETIDLPSQNILTAYLQEYYNAMLLRDIIEYNQLTNYTYLRSLYRQAASTIGKTISNRRLHNQLKSQQYNVGLNTVYDAMEMAEQAYLFKRISRFDYSDSKRERSDKKIYWLDNGLLNANTAQYTGNKGLLLENLVFKELYILFGSIYTANIYYYAESSGECDFIVQREGEIALPVQVSWTLTDESTRDREIKGLLKACTYCNAQEAWIITAEEEEELIIEEVKIYIKPAWKWMIS